MEMTGFWAMDHNLDILWQPWPRKRVSPKSVCNNHCIFILLTPKSLRDPKWINFFPVFCFEWDLWIFLDGGEISIKINEFHFAYDAPNFSRFGLNLSLVKFLKVTQRPNFHWNWTEPHDTLGNMSEWKTTLICAWKAMKLCGFWFILCFKYLPLGLIIRVFEVTSKNIM